MKSIHVLMLACLALIAGCATPPQMPVALNPDTINAKGGRIGVAMTPLPKIDTSFPGASCLLCIAAASVANSSLTTQTQKLPPEDLALLKLKVADAIRAKGGDVVVIEEPLKLDALPNTSGQGPNLSRKDFSALKVKYRIDRLLVIDIQALGIERVYSAYVPNGDPKAILRGAGYVVVLPANTYEWYMPVRITKSADGKWDEPPEFPGLSNAYFQVVELGKDEFMQPFLH